MTTGPARARRPDDRRSSVDELFTALDVLRADVPPPPQERDRAWRSVFRHVGRALPLDADARQDALVTIIESVHALRATTAPCAAAWLRAVCHSRLTDRHRRCRGIRLASLDDSLDTPAPTGAPTVQRDAAEQVIEAFMMRVDLHLGAIVDPGVRKRRRTQTLAALRRIALDESLPEIAEGLDLSISRDLLAKWIERGRRVIVDTVEADRVLDPDAADLFTPFAELALERRADAGVPRPARRRSQS